MPTDDISALEIVTIVLHLLGGKTHSIDTEDVALKASELAPERFAWRKYPERIDLQAVRFALENAKRAYCGYVVGTGNEGWMLTEAGAKYATQNEDRLAKGRSSRVRKSQTEMKWLRRERARMLATEALAKFRAGRPGDITQQEAAAFFRVDEYVTGGLRERKLLRIINEFGNDPELGEAVMALAARVREENHDD